MESEQISTPQIHFLGKIVGAQNFGKNEVYVKFSFKAGDQWSLLSGKAEGDTFQSKGEYQDVIPLEHPFDLQYKAESVRGWPKIFVEVWELDDQHLFSSGRNSIAGYGMIGIPIQPGSYKLEIPCWRPRADFYDKITGTYPELVHKDILISSDSRFGLRTESSGDVIIEIQVITKDFELQGVKIQPGDD
ncbi:hypothetical protein PPERSA_05639 [Pseudocohnilembus persalinus]|uniref:B9 domain-containing protein 2 n=1 Tax=Pseudocohnilembus persalinus TaxID=266149 RepID=A0A0V0QQR0_PSEPJ|nr:hypothetical protein PPERSA_05639 [Pseudocohnilembus persalinus]|eukprot:KRX04378.1 hypothetical protein PPERSA_05639 [Pseudocohnilembus persalinus]